MVETPHTVSLGNSGRSAGALIGSMEISTSEDAVRHNKASLSVEAAFAAEGFHSAPAALAAFVADYVNRSTKDIPASKIANMSRGAGSLGTAAAAGVNVVLGSLSSEQRDVLRAGGNPFSPADMQSLGAKLGGGVYAGLGRIEGGLGGNNGGRFAAMKEAIGGRDGSSASSAEVATLSRMSSSDFASRLGFQGEHDKEASKLFEGTSGSFRAAAADYKRVMDDPNATPEQKAAAQEKMKRSAKNKQDRNAAEKLPQVIEDMKKKGVGLDSTSDVSQYKAENQSGANTINADHKCNDAIVKGQTQTQANDTVEAEKVATVSAASKTKTDKTTKKPSTIQSTL